MPPAVVPCHNHELQAWEKATGTPLSGTSGLYIIGCDEAGRGPLAGPVVAAACCIWVPLQNCSPAAEIVDSIDGLNPLRDSKVLGEAVRASLLECIQSGMSQREPSNHGRNPFFGDVSFLEWLRGEFKNGTRSIDSVRRAVRGEAEKPSLFQQSPRVAPVDHSAPTIHSFSFKLVTAEEIDAMNILHASLYGMIDCATALVRSLSLDCSEQGERPPVLILVDGPHMPLELLELFAIQNPAPAEPVHLVTGKRGRKEKKVGTKRPREEAPESGSQLPFNGKPLPNYLEAMKRRLKANPHLATDATKPITATLTELLWTGREESGCGERMRCAALPVIKGDALCPSISMASVIAKEVRDGFMCNVVGKLIDGREGVVAKKTSGGQTKHGSSAPHYGFADHKGYPVPSHLAAVKEHGPIKYLHRFSFGPVAASASISGKKGSAEKLLSVDDFIDALLR